MRRDMLIGFCLAIALHFSVALYSTWFKNPVPVKIPLAKAELKAVPLLEPEPPEVTPDDPKDEPIKDVKYVPVSPDPIQLADPKDFVRPPEPPQPIDAKANLAVYTIPANGFGNAGSRPFTIGEVDRAPQTVLQGQAEYPAAMKAQHVTGEVLIRFIVDANNNVRDVRVVSSSDRAFDSAAVKAVQAWKFKAGMKGGKAVPVQLEVPIRFNLK